ncbi:cell death activator CIDE-B isoform X2 [Myotis lucifugus]|uniref:cell death activator CIDE-B isoform X2 n=2 Tax=Myotis TaxID=9434 RepID=UPI000CCC1D31|nr:cell death activator CIDE-B isoform X2 [Myotis lucifugus]
MRQFMDFSVGGSMCSTSHILWLLYLEIPSIQRKSPSSYIVTINPHITSCHQRQHPHKASLASAWQLWALILLPGPHLGPSSPPSPGTLPFLQALQGARVRLDSSSTSLGLRSQLCNSKHHFSPAQRRTTQLRILLLFPYTMEYLSALKPSSLVRVWTSPPPPQRPFRVCDHKRTVRKGLTAATRQELLDKALETLLLSGVLTLVLEEDGTAVESEDFFQLLEDDTCLMVLESGQSWSSSRSGMLSYGLGREKPKHSKDIARITFDVYKQNPRDLFGSLNVKATFYGLYSMSCDIQGLGPKKILREFLRWTSTLLQGLGHMLLGISSTLRHVVEGATQWQQQGHLHPY